VPIFKCIEDHVLPVFERNPPCLWSCVAALLHCDLTPKTHAFQLRVGFGGLQLGVGLQLIGSVPQTTLDVIFVAKH
jgi:hypothetical protein